MKNEEPKSNDTVIEYFTNYPGEIKKFIQEMIIEKAPKNDKDWVKKIMESK